MKTQKQAGLFSAPTPKSPLSSFSQASKTMTNDILAKYSAPLPKNALQSAVNFGIISTQSQKMIAEPGNSNDLYLANSTPQACFFIRSTRTPKERLERLSMVACNGKGFALCCVPSIAVFQPVTRYRPNPGKFSGSFHKSYLELSAMIYLFNAIKRTDFNNTSFNIHTFPKSIIRIQADNLEQARRLLSRDYFVVNTGQISSKSNRALIGVIYA